MAPKQKQQNGVTYSTKELIEDLHKKVDRIETAMLDIRTGYVTHLTCEKRREQTRNMLIGMFGTLFTLLGALASYVFLRR